MQTIYFALSVNMNSHFDRVKSHEPPGISTCVCRVRQLGTANKKKKLLVKKLDDEYCMCVCVCNGLQTSFTVRKIYNKETVSVQQH